ncbi:unnamed protein product [Clavelina lepadiformis]|uniref:MRG-binding protein n=1 Tax=Clavelina lepadiformis TaxID=159417 RepID=A0ABP0FWL6_CLALP
MRGQKPVGVNKHFRMMCIHKKFCQSLGQSVSSKQLWDHLATMYNLKALDESEIVPFQNSAQDFKLPADIFSFRKDAKEQIKMLSDESVIDEEPSQKSKTNRKRTRNTLTPASSNPSSPAPPAIKRRR